MFGNSSLYGDQQQQQQQQQQPSQSRSFPASPNAPSFAGNIGNLKPTTPTDKSVDPSITASNVIAGSLFGQASNISSNVPTTSALGTNSFGSFNNLGNSTSHLMATNMQSTTGFAGKPTGWGTTSTNTFGQPQQALAFGGGAFTTGFGQPAGGVANQSTTAMAFAPTAERDMTTGRTNFFQTITAMPQYKHQSLEELRLQDYLHNRRPQTAPGTGFETLSTTIAPEFVPTVILNGFPGDYELYQTITAMAQYRHLSTDELRLHDYQNNRKPPGTATRTTTQSLLPLGQSAAAFTTSSPSPFGAGNKTSVISGQQPISPLGQQSTTTFGQQSTSMFGTLNQQLPTLSSPQPTANALISQSNNTTGPFSFGDAITTPTTSGCQGTNDGLNQVINNHQQQPMFGITSLGTNTVRSTTISVSFNLEIDIVQSGCPIKVSATVNGMPNTNGPTLYSGTLQQQHQSQIQEQPPSCVNTGSTISHQIEPAIEVKSEGVSQKPLIEDCAQKAACQKLNSSHVNSNDIHSTQNDAYSSTIGHASQQHTTPSATDTTEMRNQVAINEGYYCIPGLDTLEKLTPDQRKKVEGFSVGRHGVGKITFDQPVDISALDLNKLLGYTVALDNHWVSIYPDVGSKPLLGDELNAPATVELINCYIYDKDTQKPIRDPRVSRYRTFLEGLRCKSGVGFVNYASSTGTWTFKINQF